jgi:amino acid adenylation domain-containing protein
MKEDLVANHSLMNQQGQPPCDQNVSLACYPPVSCIYELFETQIGNTPDAVAIVDEDRQLTYAELNRKANQLAHMLQARGVKPEVVVGLYMERSPEMIVGLLGVLKAGGAYLPLDLTFPGERLAFMLQETQAFVLLTQEKMLSQLPPYQGHVICLDRDWRQLAGEKPTSPASEATGANLAYIIYTSGSTGQPKGVMITHSGLTNYLYWCIHAYTVAQGHGSLLHSSLASDLTVTSLFAPLLVGQRLVLLPEAQDFAALGNALRSMQDLSFVKLTPAHLTLLAEQLAEEDISRCTRAFIIGGEALQQEHLAFWRARAPRTRLINEYGPTETVVGCCIYELAPGDVCADTGPVPIGRPIANTELYVLDAALQPVPDGVQGELYIAGVGVARGYQQRPDLTAERFLPNPFSLQAGARFYRTGDIVRYLPDGTIEFIGRNDSQVKLRGYRIELGEIEAVLRRHPAIQEAIVQIHRDGQDPALVAYLLGQRGVSLVIAEIQDFLKQLLPDYMHPTSIVQLETLPLMANGKVDRSRLQASELMRHKAPKEQKQPRDPLELQLVQLWERLLNVHPIGITDDFFELGGHSFLAVRLIQHIKKQFGYTVPLMDLFEQATIEHLARHLRQPFLTNHHTHLVTFRTVPSRRPLFFIHPIGGSTLCYLELAHELEGQSFYGIQAAGFYGECEPVRTIEEMAANYLQIVKAVQPTGPYLLGGWSMGGIIAFEMAQQLRRQQEEVALLTLLDCQIHEPDTLKTVDHARLLADFVIHLVGSYLHSAAPEVRHRFSHLDEQDALAFYKEVQQVSEDKQLSFVLQQAKQVGVVPADTDQIQFGHLFAVFRANYQAVRRYQPEPYTGHTLFFASEEVMKWKSLGAALGWDRLVTVNMQAHVFPGNHYTLIHGATVRLLAEQLALAINQLQ